MADLRSNFESTLVTLRNLPFEVRWSHYWSMVLDALERTPESLEQLSRLILDQEEQLATADGRATIAEMLGSDRDQLRREADAEVMHLLQPFRQSDGTPEQRAELAAERKRIRSEIQPHAEHADSADAYETYVLVLNYTTAFATAATAVFRGAETGREAPGPAQQNGRRSAPPRPAPAEMRERELAEQHERELAEQHERELAERHERELAEQHEREITEMREREIAEIRAREPAQIPVRDPANLRARDPAPRRYEVAPGEEAYRTDSADPPEYLEPPETARSNREPERRRGRLGKSVAAGLVLCLIASGVAAYLLKPEWFDLSDPAPSASTGDRRDEPVAEETENPERQTPAEQTETETPPEPEPTKSEVPSTPLDRYYAAIIGTEASECTPPAEIAKSSWTEISTFVECAKTHGVELVSTFRFMLTRAGGKWSENGTWGAPEGPMKEQLLAAWKHVTQTRNRWNAEASAAVKEYASSYFGFQSHGTTGWRFAAWRCRCNINGEFDVDDTANVKPRLFITRPARIETEDDARIAYAQVRNFFLGPDAPGNAQTVEQGISNVHLPYDLPGGLGMARPLETKEAADQAWSEVTALHAGIGFAVSELKWTAN